VRDYRKGDVVRWARGHGADGITGPLRDLGFTDYVGIVDDVNAHGDLTVTFDPWVWPYTITVSPEQVALCRRGRTYDVR
jgi:hypothetical protein